MSKQRNQAYLPGADPGGESPHPIHHEEPDMADEHEQPDDEAADTGRRMDSELKTLAAILRLLGEMPESARARIILYLSSRFAEGRP